MNDPMGLLLAAARVDPVLMMACRRVEDELRVAQATINQLTAEMATMHRSVVHQCCEDVQAERKLAAELADLVAYMLDDADGDDPCSLDHHGYCQHHVGGFRDGGCWVPAARLVLERRAEREATS